MASGVVEDYLGDEDDAGFSVCGILANSTVFLSWEIWARSMGPESWALVDL